MKFDTPAGANPIDQLKVVGQPTDRIDGPLKTTGTAPYAYERHDVVPNQPPTATWSAPASPRAASAPWTSPTQGRARRARDRHGQTMPASSARAMQHRQAARRPDIEHYHQAIAAGRRRNFRAGPRGRATGRSRLRPAEGAFDLAEARHRLRHRRPSRQRRTAGYRGRRLRRQRSRRAGEARRDLHDARPSHAMMEPHASIAAWDGDKLTLWTSNQMIDWGRDRPRQDPRHPEGEGPPRSRPTSAAASAASCSCAPTRCWRRLARARRGRPVKVALPRPLIANNTTHRPATIQRIRIGATPDGTITAIGHESWSGDLPGRWAGDGGTADTRCSMPAPTA